MGSIWFCLVAFLLAGYVVLDGFDLGAGILHLWIARNETERCIVLRSIGPVWSGNEVWLVAAGGTLYFGFPALYASSFSGFYLPLMVVLWLLIFRGIALEFRGHIGGPIWPVFWDACFTVSSLLLAVFFGAALGNVVRGVPLDDRGRFFEPLWTNFLPYGQTGILDWYTILAGVVALAILTLHGAAWLACKTDGELNERALRCASRLWWLVALLIVAITVTSFRLAPRLAMSFHSWPWGLVFPILAIAGFLGIKWSLATKRDAWAFGMSCLFIGGMLATVAFSLYPNVLPASTNPIYSLTVSNAKAPDYGLKIGLVWWPIGMALAACYTIFAYRSFAGKIRAPEAENHEGY
jgi:cytochrome bd ubiquinol oxidase subunit II